MEREQKSLPFELKEFDDATGEMTGFAAAFGNLDDGDDVIMPGAFSKTLQEGGHRVRILWQHDRQEPIGKPVEMREVGAEALPEAMRARFPGITGGLLVRGIISDTRRGRDARVLMRDGVVNELSIGYDAIKSEYKSQPDGKRIRELQEIRLWEFSPVTWAMNPAALITDAKNEPEPTEVVDTPEESAEPSGSSLTVTVAGLKASSIRIQSYILEVTE